jgi:hypothetical protein
MTRCRHAISGLADLSGAALSRQRQSLPERRSQPNPGRRAHGIPSPPIAPQRGALIIGRRLGAGTPIQEKIPVPEGRVRV